MVRELGKIEGLLEAAIVDRKVEVAGGGSGQSRDSPRTGSRVDNVAEVAQGQMAREQRGNPRTEMAREQRGKPRAELS